MKIIDKRLIETSEIIDRKFAKVDEENRSDVSTDILPHLRNFCEAFMYKVYDEDNSTDLYQTQDNLKIVRSYFKAHYCDLDKFHALLDSSVGHMEFGRMQSEALTIKYIPKLIVLKDFLSRKYGISVLENIDKYPLDLDDSITSFYEKILYVLLHSPCDAQRLSRNQYFVRKRSMRYINGHIFYEYVFDVSDDKTNKYNTFVCYSFKNIRFDYDLKLILSKKQITFLNTKIFINVIYDYEYSIRPCTFKNLLYLINIDTSDGKRDKDYHSLMRYIKEKRMSLLDIIDNGVDLGLQPNGYYDKFLKTIKDFVKRNGLGTNTVRLLLLDMQNSTIKAQRYIQFQDKPAYNEKFNGLRIHLGTKAFEKMPFAFSPKVVNPSLHTIYDLFNASGAEGDILYHYMDEYINQNNTLFIKPEDIGYSNERFIELKDKFNEKLLKENSYYSDHVIICVNGYYTIESYYILTKSVVARALELCKKRVQFVENDYSGNMLLSEKQKDILTDSFKRSSISLVTGAAGTGKTTLIKEFIKNNSSKRILCLTTTNTANNNIKVKDCETVVKYLNIAQFKKEREHAQFDIIIVDEASFVSTKAINDILSAYNNSAFLLVGDPEQIESIEFGNWFDLLLNILQPQKVVYALEKEYRTDVKEISNIWTEVRAGKKKNILELLSAYEMTEKIKDNYEIFDVKEGEVVLCLNYDGLYGINNINRYLQASNPNEAHEYQENLYKEGDPVIFIINDYSTYGIYNNLKGKIESINEDDDNIAFKIRLYDKIGYLGRLSNEIRIVEEDGISYAIVEKMKYYTDKYDSDMDSRTKLPFQIAYAMSIHKAQGLEFDSVKIVITKEADESITKNIFYTAVTRAKNKLKVYWEPEVANYVLDNIENSVKAQKVDLSIIGEQMKKNR